MLNLPGLPIERIPATRTARKGEQLKQFVINDKAAWREAIEKWVPETAKAGHAEIVAAGNPKVFTSEIDGTSGKSGTQRRGFVPGPIAAAHTAARVLYSGQDLAETANKLRAVLGATIRKTFPRSRLQRLARDWVWYRIRDGLNERNTPEYLGGMVSVEIGLYDLLYLVPDGPEPALYAYMANWNAKHNNKRPLTKRQQKLRKSGPRKNASKNPRDRREGFMAEASRRMRALHLPGVKVRAVFVEEGLTAGFSKSPRMPAVRLCFDKYMRRAVHT